MSDLISREEAVRALGDAHFKNYGNAIMVIQSLPSAEPVKNELMTDFVDTAEKAARVEIMSKKDAQVTLDAWKMRISEADHDSD